MSKIVSVFLLSILLSVCVFAQPMPTGKSATTIDLATTEGARLVKGIWRYSDVKLIEVDFKAADSEGQPTGKPVKTFDYSPHAGISGFDDSKWKTIAPTELNKRRGNGRISFNWYRINITVPDNINRISTAGKTLVFQTSIDDYAEIWVDGELTRKFPQSGGSVVKGWNAPNRLVIGRNVKPGQKIQIAVFGINGPISNSPTNFIFMREAKLELFRGITKPIAITPQEVNVRIIQKDSSLEKIVGANPKIFKIAEGFKFTEGPVWIGDGLLFSDPDSNTIYKYSRDNELTVFRKPSGYDGKDIDKYRQPGSNGLTLDPQGYLTINQHGNRRVVRLGDKGEEILADRFEGKRLNSPNDLVYRSDGTLFFSDPPFGLPKVYDDPEYELKYAGVYSLHKGKLNLLTKAFKGPNGIALSPDEKYLYVGNWDTKKSVVYKYELNADGTVKPGKLFYDLTDESEENSIDGIKVDVEGNLYVSGPGGLWVFSKEGKHLGTIVAPQPIHNMAWGDNGKMLYLCARHGIYRMPLKIPGMRPRVSQ